MVRDTSKAKVSLLAVVLLVAASAILLFYRAPSFAQTGETWKEKWAEVVARAEKEGRVVVAGNPGAAIRKAVTEGFRKAFPKIELEYIGITGGDLARRLSAERAGGVYSVDVAMQGTTTTLLYLKPMGAVEPIEEALILPAVIEPKHWRDSAMVFSDRARRYNPVFAVSVSSNVIFNLEQVRLEDVDELYHLVNPRWQGKFVINDPTVPGAGNTSFMFFWHALGPEKAPDYFRRLRAHTAAVTRDERRMIEWVAVGKYAFAIAPSDRLIGEMEQRGLKVGVVPHFREHGSVLTASTNALSLINRAPHPNAAVVFINWLLTREAQIAMSRATGFTSLRADVPTDHIQPYRTMQAGVKYWPIYIEDNVAFPPGYQETIKKLFAG